MINRKITMSAMSIVAALTLVGGATFAFFSDTASSTNNQFRSGTFDLTVQDNDESFRDNISQSFVTPSSWAPGDKYISYICFKNNGTTPIQQILFSLTSTDANTTTLDNFVYVSNIELGNVTSTPSACDAVGTVGSDGLTNFKTLFDTRFGVNASLNSLITQIDGTDNVNDDLLDGVGNVMNQGDLYKFRVEWTFDPTATSAVAGATVNADLGFNATQNELP